jgi:hypothetical protein
MCHKKVRWLEREGIQRARLRQEAGIQSHESIGNCKPIITSEPVATSSIT